ncbi:hypothetical protein M0802_003398 [Mischocyttarus mexicanus]|nr:hypothetical protein M0802_003398 [Mischocyttarus mexicanus]
MNEMKEQDEEERGKRMVGWLVGWLVGAFLAYGMRKEGINRDNSCLRGGTDSWKLWQLWDFYEDNLTLVLSQHLPNEAFRRAFEARYANGQTFATKVYENTCIPRVKLFTSTVAFTVTLQISPVGLARSRTSEIQHAANNDDDDDDNDNDDGSLTTRSVSYLR